MSNEFALGGIVPWGRTAAEYEAFFALSDVAEGSRILDCAGGPASFVAEWGSRGHFAVSADPLYARSPEQIATAFAPVATDMLRGMRAARDRFRWEYYGSPEAVVERRRVALSAFLSDRRAPHPVGRYIAARLPLLPFASDSFDLVLCSHLLFLYSGEIDLQLHLASLREMLRVGREVRVFPLLDLNGKRSKHLDRVAETLENCELIQVPFEFQAGARSMLRLRREYRSADGNP
jgi:SAM-dependent methyltransferase